MSNRVEMNENLMEQVNGGNFLRNDLSEETYNKFGIKTDYHWLSADKFTLPDGTETNQAGANAYIRNLVGDLEYGRLSDRHFFVNEIKDYIDCL